ncbi:histidine phosphotransferase ChpT [Roseivivax lentus]|uniref:Histidine phosphotransferase ChpT n=1 Tax=Roseivivax lentus TaxID=633194 RepID=A0A1N7N686_9RHOB|nr:histidine phosphotransferase family protein [Roseivivax lentus]SIS93768.1 histidine phosphotransferase ChpT [Roseivivax lentus]
MDKTMISRHGTADLAALIGSRICHDLISPIGAIGNGIELMAMIPGGADGPELELVSDSCRAAQARIRFFRVAFGSSMQSDQTMSANEAGAILIDFASGGRQRPDWQATGDLPRSDVQLVFLAYLCFETALPRGGRIDITRQDGHWQLHADSEALSVDASLWSTLTGTPLTETPTPAHVQFMLLPIVAADLGRAITVGRGEARLTLSV